MYLNPKNIAFYLFEKGLLSWEESLAGVQSYLEAGSRSFGFKIEMVCGKNFFIKQIKNNFDGMSRLLETEALVLQTENFTEKPTFYLHDKKNGILVNSLVNNAQNVGEFIKNEGFLIPIATQLGLVLSNFHQVEFKENHFQNPAQKQPPLVFYLGTATGRNFLKQKRERFTTQFLEQIALYPALLEAIAEAHKNWESKTLIHGDMKFENCLIQSFEDDYKIQLIDFEEVTMGNSLWDVAGIMQAAISIQLQKTHFLIFSPFSPFHPLLDDAVFCEWLQTFWGNYQLNNEAEVKLIQYTGMRLIGRLMEIAQQADVSHQAKEWLPLAQEMIENPEKYLKLTKSLAN
jgi:thiamine kinase-like enzyme